MHFRDILNSWWRSLSSLTLCRIALELGLKSDKTFYPVPVFLTHKTGDKVKDFANKHFIQYKESNKWFKLKNFLKVTNKSTIVEFSKNVLLQQIYSEHNFKNCGDKHRHHLWFRRQPGCQRWEEGQCEESGKPIKTLRESRGFEIWIQFHSS